MISLMLFFPTTITMISHKTVTALTEDTTPPLVEIIKPINALYIFDRPYFKLGSPILTTMQNIVVNATDNESGVNRVEFYINGVLEGNDTAMPYTYLWNKFLSGKSTIKVIAYDNAGNSASKELQVLNLRWPHIIVIPMIILLVLFLLIAGGQLLP